MNRRSAATSGGSGNTKNVTGFLKDNASDDRALIIVAVDRPLRTAVFQRRILRTLPAGFHHRHHCHRHDVRHHHRRHRSFGGRRVCGYRYRFSILTKFGYELWGCSAVRLLLGAIVGIVNGFRRHLFRHPAVYHDARDFFGHRGACAALCDGFPWSLPQ